MNNKNVKTFLSAIFLTNLGSNLTTFAFFYQMKEHFGLELLPLVLSAKTLSTFGWSFFAPVFVHFRGYLSVLVWSQIIGVCTLIAMSASWYASNFIAFLSFLLISGLPSSLANIVLSAALKNSCSDESHFRKSQGIRTTLAGIAFLLSATCTPFLIDKWGIKPVILLDAVSFLGAGLAFYKVSSKFNASAPQTVPLSSALKNLKQVISFFSISKNSTEAIALSTCRQAPKNVGNRA